jgi:hypothetical protein
MPDVTGDHIFINAYVFNYGNYSPAVFSHLDTKVGIEGNYFNTDICDPKALGTETLENRLEWVKC